MQREETQKAEICIIATQKLVAPNGRKDQIRIKINTNWGKISNRNVNVSQN